jgi:glycosyltransferase involved in cell wall biosynthesis
VIATRCGGPEEIVTSETGLLVDRDDDRALMEAMAEMLGRQFDPAALHDSARRRFGHDAVAGRLSRVYDAIATERREIVSQRRDVA